MMSEDLHGSRLRPGEEKDNYEEPGVPERDDEVLPHCHDDKTLYSHAVVTPWLCHTL